MTRIVFLGPPGPGRARRRRRWRSASASRTCPPGTCFAPRSRRRRRSGIERRSTSTRAGSSPTTSCFRILRERLDEPDARGGFLLDGFPRTLVQARALAAVSPVDRVVFFEIPEALLLERLTQRRTCPKCGTWYNLSTRPPKLPGRCDVEGAELQQRSDDREDAVRTRLKVYQQQTHPLVAHYQQLGLLRSVNAEGAPDEVRARVAAAVS